MQNRDCYIVGAGLFGSVVAERLAANGFSCYIFEKRAHIAGNCYDTYDSNTYIPYNVYGPHIFYSSDIKVISYIKQFAEFNRYFHQVKSCYNGIMYPFPFNLDTINRFYGLQLLPDEIDNFLKDEAAKENISVPQNVEEKAISMIGRPLYEAFIKEYTLKQWGKAPADLPESVLQRISVRSNYYASYYPDNIVFQGLPINGYTAMVQRILQSERIEILLNTDFFSLRESLPAKANIVYTGPLDRFFEYRYGHLEYRKVTFVKELHHIPDKQGISVINYPECFFRYTRICEPKHFYRERWNTFAPDATITFKEIPGADWGEDPFYPINDEKNALLARKYALEARSNFPRVIFGGRLGEYKYYNMSDVIAAALRAAETLVLRLSREK
jgi:UDP-galactopyranose mutase